MRFDCPEGYGRSDRRCGDAMVAGHALLRALFIAEEPAAGSTRRVADGPEATRFQPHLSERPDVRLLTAGILAGRGFLQDRLRARRSSQDRTGYAAAADRFCRDLLSRE